MQNNFNIQTYLAFTALAIVTIILTAIALWRSAHANQKPWFIAILILGTYPPISLIINTVYLFFFSKKKLTFGEIKSWFGK